MIAHQGSDRHVLHLPMALEFWEQSLLSAPAVVEGHDIFVLGGFIGHDDLEVESPLVRDEQIQLEGFLVELSDSVADTHQAVAPLPLLGFPGSLKEEELPSFIDC